MTTRSRYERHLKDLQVKLLNMCCEVEYAIESAINALVNRDRELATIVYENDHAIDKMEHDIEQECLKLLLLEHPVAGDFKEVSGILKMITDLERIGDQAADICSLILSLGDEDCLKSLTHIPKMAEIALSMVKDSIHSYVLKNHFDIKEIEKRDDIVDELFKKVKLELIDYIKIDSDNADQAIIYMMIAKYLERIGDHATNISEWAEYCITGQRSFTDPKE